jgi:hypothetical protein
VPCQIHFGGATLEGRVRNVSEGGLALEAALPPQGDGTPLRIRLALRGRPSIELTALVWRVRPARRPGGPSHLGLVLSDAGDDYFEWLESVRRLVPAGERVKAPPPGTQERFAVRVAESGSPRSRRILVVAAGPDDARARALAEVGRGWDVLAVEPARD